LPNEISPILLLLRDLCPDSISISSRIGERQTPNWSARYWMRRWSSTASSPETTSG